MPRSRGIKSIRIIRSICHTFSWHYYDNNIFHNRNSLSVLIEKVFILSLFHFTEKANKYSHFSYEIFIDIEIRTSLRLSFPGNNGEHQLFYMIVQIRHIFTEHQI